MAVIALLFFGLGLFSFSRSNTASAAVGINHQINFQGKLVNLNGTNVTDGSYSVVFSIYNVSTAGTALWTETQTVTVTQGIFQVNLGSVTVLPGTIDFNTDNIYLGIKVGADAEMTPRVTFTAVPQSFNSEKLGGLDKTGFIQNGTSQQAASNFNISGAGTVGTSLTTPLLQSAAATGLNITGNAASTWSTSAGNITLQAGGGTVSLGSTTALSSTGALTITGGSTLALTSTGANAISLDSGTTGGINIGTNANAKTITLGNVTGATSVVIDCGTGACNFGVSATAHPTTVGSLTSTSTTTLQAGTGGLNIGTGGIANTIQIGTTTSAVIQTINIGNNATAASTSNVLIGSTIAGSTTIQNSATLNLNSPTIVGNATTQNLFNTVATTINFGGAASILNVGPTGATATSVNIAGGSAATGCTVDGATGNQACSGTLTGTVINGTTGFQLAGAATTGQYLRGNGTNFVSSAIQAADLPTGSGSYIQNGTAQQASSNFNISGAGTLAVATINGGTQPAAVAGAGTTATGVLTVTGGKGGNTTGTTGQLAGGGAAASLTSGAGGDAPAGSTNGNGGNIALQGGAPGAGAGVAGSYGNLLLQANGGNVGIGTGSPAYKLTVGVGGTSGTEKIVAQFDVNGAGAQNPAIALSSNSTFGLKLSQSNFFSEAVIDNSYASATLLQLAVRGSAGITLFNGGNVGIGSTANNAGVRLDVDGGDVRAGGTNGFKVNDNGKFNYDGAINSIVLKTLGTENLVLQTAGTQRLRITNAGNIGIGNSNDTYKVDVTGDINSSTLYRLAGSTVLRAPNATSTLVGVTNNTVTTGINVTSVGNNALQLNSTGTDNTALGFNALQANTTTSGNTAVGSQTLQANSSGLQNTAVGVQALKLNTSGFNNTGIGGYALTNNVGGQYNSAVGLNALFSVNSGSRNTSLGFEAGSAITTGSNNTFLGSSAGATGTTNNLTNATAIGYNAQVTSSSSLILGGTGTDAVNVGIGTTAPAAVLNVVGAQPLAVATAGTAATGVLTVTGGKGGNTTGTTGQLGGAGATLGLTSGAGGDAPAGSTNGNGGSISIQGGAPGAGAGTAGSYGNLLLQSAGGRVGIGTGSPTARLTVYSDANNFSDFNGGSITLNTIFETTPMFKLNSTAAASNGAQANHLELNGYQNASTRLLTASYGNLGIQTATPNANLQVDQATTGPGLVSTNGTTTLTGSNTKFLNTFNVGDTITVSGETVRTITAIASNGSLTVSAAFSTTAGSLTYTLTGGTRFVVQGNGNVGIGTAAPEGKLDIRQDQNSQTFLTVKNGSTGGLATAVSRYSNTNATGLADSFTVGVTGTGWGGYGTLLADTAFLNAESGLSGGVLIGTEANAPIRFTTFGAANERARIDSSGDFSIGSTAGGARLVVQNTTASSNVDIFRILSSVGGANNVKYRIDSDGDVFTDGSVTMGTPADLAENVPVGEPLEAGDVVTLRDSFAAYKTIGAYDAKAIGVISEMPGIVLSGDTTGAPLALAGRVPVKITNENGSVQAGDYLTSSSTPGYAMKATRPGIVIGKALESFNGATGKVLTLVGTMYYNPYDGNNIQATTVNAANLQTTGDISVGGDTALSGKLNVSGATKLTSLTVSGPAVFEADLTVQGSVSIAQNLTVVGVTKVADIIVGGKIISSGSAPSLVIGAAAGTSAQNQSAPSMTIDGTDTAGTITVTSGTTITDPGALAELTFAKAFEPGTTFKVALTPTNGSALDIRVFIEKTASGFRIVSKDKLAAGTSYSFDYIVIGAQQVATTN